MSADLFQHTKLTATISDLRKDLLAEDGPRISTLGNRPFAILVYAPDDEFELRRQVGSLETELRAQSWQVLRLSLFTLLLERLKQYGEDFVEALVARERRLERRAVGRGLAHLKEKIVPLIEGPDGIAADAAKAIQDFVAAHPGDSVRRLVLLGRTGALYPFFRSSALLKHLDGRTEGVPVVLLYPGRRHGQSGLSFMGTLPPDRDYRPRIYG